MEDRVMPNASTDPEAPPPEPPDARAATSSSFSSPILTLREIFSPFRQTSTPTALPISVSATIRGRTRTRGTSLPSNLRMMSPASNPAVAAGPGSKTLATKAPRGLSRARLSAISSVTGWMRTPSQPRRISPNSRSWRMIGLARLAAMANPMPTLPPEGEKMAVFTPITLPSMLNRGPPELPRLIDASVWMKSS